MYFIFYYAFFALIWLYAELIEDKGEPRYKIIDVICEIFMQRSSNTFNYILNHKSYTSLSIVIQEAYITLHAFYILLRGTDNITCLQHFCFVLYVIWPQGID